VYGLGKRRFFLEGVGFGVFPRLMKEMKKQKNDSINNPEKKLKTAVEILHDIVQTYKAKTCIIKIDGIEYSGKFLLAEVMNTRSIGPNLNLAPFADPGDGLFEVVLIPEGRRSEFLKYLETKADGNERLTFFHTFSANKLEIFWKGKGMHIDDELMTLDKPKKVNILLQKGALRFLVPAE
jgi:diacylglycerol kinase family enzyme